MLCYAITYCKQKLYARFFVYVNLFLKGIFMKNDLTKSLGMYLIAIDDLLKNKGSIIVKDIAEYVKKGGASTSEAVKKLKEKKYINYEPYGNITLTEKGKDAVMVKKYRHDVIKNFLNKVLDITEKRADENANIIEYSMTEDVLTRLVNFLDFMSQCACSEPKWVKSCKYSLKDGKISENCKSCSGECCCSK